MSTALQPALVLRTRPFRETSLLVDIFSRDAGRLRLLARGAKAARRTRSAKSSGPAPLQSFQEFQMSWRGKSDLQTLTAAEPGPVLLTRPDRLVIGMYLNELLFYLLGEADPHPPLYALYTQTLAQLDADAPLELLLRTFELELFAALGYAIDLSQDAAGNPLRQDHSYQYAPEAGLHPTPANSPNALPGTALLSLHQHGPQDPTALRAAKRLCRTQLERLLGGRTLKSREWYRQAAPPMRKIST